MLGRRVGGAAGRMGGEAGGGQAGPDGEQVYVSYCYLGAGGWRAGKRSLL